MIDIENCPLDGGLPRTRTSGNDANRRCQRSLDGVPLLLSEGEPHLFLLGINLVIQVAHIGQFVPAQHLADLYSHIVLSLCYDRAIDVVTINCKPIVFEHFKCPLGNSLPGHRRRSEQIDRPLHKAFLVHGQVPAGFRQFQRIEQASIQPLRCIHRDPVGLRQPVCCFKINQITLKYHVWKLSQ